MGLHSYSLHANPGKSPQGLDSIAQHCNVAFLVLFIIKSMLNFIALDIKYYLVAKLISLTVELEVTSAQSEEKDLIF